MAIDRRRRNFLKASAGIGLTALIAEIGCGPDDQPAKMPDICASKLPTQKEMEAGALQKGPYIQYLDKTTVRMRFETRVDADVPVIIERNEATERYIPDRVAEDLDYKRGLGNRSRPRADQVGPHVLHTLILRDLTPGETLSYAVLHNAGDPICGTFTVPPSPNTSFKLGWIADTMYPTSEGSINCLIAQHADLVLHGGDLVYDTNPIDSWNELFALLQPILQRSAMHFNVGNHEFESQNEIVVQFDRLLQGQGHGSHLDDAGTDQSLDAHARPRRYHSFYYAGVLFICLDTESRIPEEDDFVDGELIEAGSDGIRDLLAENSEQLQWLDAQLAQANADPDVHNIVVSFHRPLFTWSKYGTRSDTLTLRDILHPRFVDAGVSLVLAGHVHAFEYFEVDGIPYVVDGGGGALGVDPHATEEEVLAERPEEEAFHVTSSASYGITTVDFDGKGGFTVRRFLDTEPDTPLFERTYSGD